MNLVRILIQTKHLWDHHGILISTWYYITLKMLILYVSEIFQSKMKMENKDFLICNQAKFHCRTMLWLTLCRLFFLRKAPRGSVFREAPPSFHDSLPCSILPKCACSILLSLLLFFCLLLASTSPPSSLVPSFSLAWSEA